MSYWCNISKLSIYRLFLLPRSALQSVRDDTSNQVSAVFQLYEQNTDSLDLLTVTERSATAPSAADMLEWLQDAERYYRQQYPYCSDLDWLGFAFVCLFFFFFPQLICSDSWEGRLCCRCSERKISPFWNLLPWDGNPWRLPVQRTASQVNVDHLIVMLLYKSPCNL